MALSVKASGAQAATPGSEHDLLDTSDPGIYTLWVDVAALVADEVIELRVYSNALSGGTERLTHYAEFVSNSGQPLVRTPPYDVPWGARFTLTQVGGSSRSFPWSVNQL
jgi:hypothetical protein